MNNTVNLFNPITLKSGVSLRNRIFMAPMTIAASFENGMITGDEIAYYEMRSKEVGAVITACAYVSFEGKAWKGGPSADSDDMIPGLAKLASSIQKNGAKAILQLYHGGRMVRKDAIGGGQNVSASAVIHPQNKSDMPKALTHDEITDMIAKFADATKRAIDAGFDGVELHGANGYLLQQFLSPHSNVRTDEWGGNLKNRMNFPLAVVEAAKKKIEEYATKPFVLGYRITPEESDVDGIKLEDALAFIAELKNLNCLDYLHVSWGNLPASTSNDSNNQEPVAVKIKKITQDDLVLITNGNISSKEDLSNISESGVEMVAVGRPLILDPNWVSKIEADSSVRTALTRSTLHEIKVPQALWAFAVSFGGFVPFSLND